MQFENRAQAALRLADALTEWRGKNPLVLAIPRGAAPMGRLIAEALDGELDVVLTRKIGAPGEPEFAIGAVGESGWSIIDASATSVGATREYIDQEIAAQRVLMTERRRRYTPHRKPIEVAGRTVIIVDDGLATGATMVAALHETRDRHPALLVCAVPVASTSAYVRVSRYADRVICLEVSDDFYGVGQFYRDFAQVSDAEVIATLSSSVQRTSMERP